DTAVGHHGGQYQRGAPGDGATGGRISGEGRLRGGARRGRRSSKGSLTQDARTSGHDQERLRHRRRLEALSHLGLHTAPDLALNRGFPSPLYAIKESPTTTSSRGAASHHDLHHSGSLSNDHRGGMLGMEGPHQVYMQQQDSEASEESNTFKIRRPLTTKELTRKIKRHQSAIMRERRRFIAGAERPP
ncbi:hypothetical protein Hamer_G023690, partial [Homarus americanus]